MMVFYDYILYKAHKEKKGLVSNLSSSSAAGNDVETSSPSTPPVLS